MRFSEFNILSEDARDDVEDIYENLNEDDSYDYEPLYHATLKAFLPSIKQNGLLPGGNLRMFDWSDASYVYLANYPDVAQSFLDLDVIEPSEEAEEKILQLAKQGGVLLKIDQNKLNRSQLGPDPHMNVDPDDGAETYIYRGVIPPSAIIGVEDFSLTEHKMIWSRSGQKLKLKYRCASGPKAGRIVPDPKACAAPKDVAKMAQMKRTRATTKIRQARKAKKTKRVNPASKILARLNALTRPATAPKSKVVRMTSKSTRKPQPPKK